MTKNAIMIKEKREKKSLMRINQTRRTNGILKNEKMSAERKQIKRLHAKSPKGAGMLSTSNLSFKYNEKMFENQIQQLNLMFKQSLMCPTLTQNELDILAMKYKVDGHYRINKNLPPFKTLLENTHNVINGNADSYEQAQCTPNNNIQELKHRNSGACGKSQSLENSSTHVSAFQANSRLDLPKTTGTFETYNGDREIDNRYFGTIDDTLTNTNHNYLSMNHTMQAQNNVNVLNDIKDFAQSTPNASTKYMNDLQEQSSCSSRNSQNIISEEYQTYSNLFSNVPDSNTQLEYMDITSATSEQSGTHSLLHHNSFSLHSSFCNNLHFNKWNNDTSTIVNNKPWKKAQLICIPHIANFESRHNIKNSAAAHPLTLIKGHMEEENNLNSCNHTYTNTVNNKNSAHTFNSDTNSVQQDYNPCPTNSNDQSDISLPEMNTFIPFPANLNYQCY